MRMRRSVFAYPYVVWMAIFILSPMLLILYYAFTNDGGVTIGCGEEDWIAYSAEYMESGEEIGVKVPADKIAVSANEAN